MGDTDRKPAADRDESPSAPTLFGGWADEIELLCVLIWLRILDEDEARESHPDADSVRDRVSVVQREFVERRFGRRTLWYRKAVNRLNLARAIYTGAIVAGGFLISAITAIDLPTGKGLPVASSVVIGLGVVVGVLGVVGPQVVRAQLIERYRRGMNNLRREAWLFVTRHSPYTDQDPSVAFDLFVARVEQIEGAALATDLDITGET